MIKNWLLSLAKISSIRVVKKSKTVD